MPPARTRRRAAAPPIEETVEQDGNVVMPQPADDYRKTSLPVDKIEFRCGDCNSACAIHVKDNPGDYTAAVRQEMFLARGSSYMPPLCGFCVRARARARKKPAEAAA